MNHTPRVVAIGGGTGLSALLRSIKAWTPQITAVVAVTDDGGGSGTLRREMGILPPGDIRNCVMALANCEPDMARIIGYRFQEGGLEGQSLGNLLLAAAAELGGGFQEGVEMMARVLAITGRVLAVTLDDVELVAELSDGSLICGESRIPSAQRQRHRSIRDVRFTGAAYAQAPVLQAIEEADLVLLGPGSLYTSVIPPLLVGGVVKALQHSRAFRLYVANLMTQPGETDGMDLAAHVAAIQSHCQGSVLDGVLCHRYGAEKPELLKRYDAEGAEPLGNDIALLEGWGLRVWQTELLQPGSKNYMRHDADRLRAALACLWEEVCSSCPSLGM